MYVISLLTRTVIASMFVHALVLPNEADGQTINKDIGVQTNNCSPSDDAQIFQAMAIITQARTSNLFASCMRSATLWNDHQCFDRPPVVIQEHAINTFYSFPFAYIECADLSGSRLGEALVTIRPHDEIALDYSLLARHPGQIAGTIVHEIMHATGMFLHEVTGRHYNFSVPEQAESCIERGRPNAGPCTVEPRLPPCPPIKNQQGSGDPCE